MFSLPTSITIQDKEYAIRNNGDYRMVMDCFLALTDSDLTTDERIMAGLMIFYDDFNSVDDVLSVDDMEPFVLQMYWFMNCGESNDNAKHSPKLIDWEQDSQMIFSAVNRVAGKEVRLEEYMHWWTFMGYYMAIGECTLSFIVGIRNKMIKGKKLEKHEREFKRDNPQYFRWNKKPVDDAEADKLFNELWNNKEE